MYTLACERGALMLAKLLSKKIDFSFSKSPKKEETENKGKTIEEYADRQIKISSFAIGFLINLALCAIILSIALVST